MIYQKLTFSLLLVLLLSGCQTSKEESKELKGDLMHTVIVWLEDESQKDEMINETITFINQIDEVKSYYIGMPAMTPRDIVDNSYSFYLTLIFEKKADLNTYQEHPAHVGFLQKYRSNTKKILIYDVGQ